LLKSDLIRRHSDDDLSLAVIRRVEPPARGSLRVGRLSLMPTTAIKSGCETWLVDGCSSLLAMAPDPTLPTRGGIATRKQQVLDRGSRYARVNWPVRRIEHGLILVQRPPQRTPLVGAVARRSGPVEMAELLAGVRSSVETLHRSGLSHGHLSLDSFVVYPNRTVVLWEPGPGMFEGADQDALAERDRSFLSGISASERIGSCGGDGA